MKNRSANASDNKGYVKFQSFLEQCRIKRKKQLFRDEESWLNRQKCIFGLILS